MAGRAFAAIGAAAVVAAGAMGAIVKSAINNADAMSKMSQKAGVSVESLSRLVYAGSLADVSMETLGTSFAKLSKNMAEIAMGKGGAAKTAFETLGISAVNLDNSLRKPDEVLLDIAERFKELPDGATKTALAVQLFGRSGAELIPLLNGGRDGLKEMADEADRLGITLDTTTAQSAEAFNDQLTRLQAIFQGIANKIMVAVMPALRDFSMILTDPEIIESAVALSKAIVDGMAWAVKAINATVQAVKTLGQWMKWASTHDIFGNPVEKSEAAKALDRARAMIKLREDLKNPNVTPAAGWSAADLGFAVATKGDRLQQAKDLTDITTESEKIPVIFDRASESVKETAEKTKTLKDEMTEAEKAAQEFGRRVESSFADVGNSIRGLIDGTSSWNDVLISVVETVARLAFQQLDFGGTSTGGGNGIWGDIIGGFITGLTGFADGGSFKVGGSGGVDSQPVGFMASPDEVVSVMTPEQQKEAARSKRSAGKVINIENNLNISTPDARSFKASESQIAGRLALMTQRGARNL